MKLHYRSLLDRKQKIDTQFIKNSTNTTRKKKLQFQTIVRYRLPNTRKPIEPTSYDRLITIPTAAKKYNLKLFSENIVFDHFSPKTKISPPKF